MRHEERMQLASDLCARMVAKYPDEVVLAGICGSTARGTDTPWSDLDMLLVVRDESKIESRHYIFRTTAVGYLTVERGKLEQVFNDPTAQAAGLRWPVWMGMLGVLQVVHGDPKQVQTWLRLEQSLPDEKFRRALEACLPDLVVESYGRILSCRERQNAQDVYCAVIEVLFEMRDALCLLNRRWVTHDYYQGLIDTFSFPKLPEGFRELVPALWKAREIDEILPWAERLVQNYWQLLADEGIKVANYQNVEELPL